MHVLVNGEPTDLPAGATVASAVAALELPASGRGVAVALDAEVVPHGAWAATSISDGARLEVVRAIQGG
ncbi:MAG: sulfur carrier protein ThiS [Solirubrobacteraceae bacterium]